MSKAYQYGVIVASCFCFFGILSCEATQPINPSLPPNQGALPTTQPTELSQKLPAKAQDMRFVDIPAGTFMMGAPESEPYSMPEERPQHSVTLNAFEMQATEVTQGQWESVMGIGNWPDDTHYPGSNDNDGVGPNYPMYYVNWCDIVGASGDPEHCSSVPVGQSFLDKLNASGTNTYRLPTEAEWEYAARAGSTTQYACGDYIGFNGGTNANVCPYNMGWFLDNNSDNASVKEVGSKQANAWGLYDMHGNVREWVQDWYDPSYYGKSPQSNPMGSMKPPVPVRVIRGGSWVQDARGAISSSRGYSEPTSRGFTAIGGHIDGLGFRLVRQSQSKTNEK